MYGYLHVKRRDTGTYEEKNDTTKTDGCIQRRVGGGEAVDLWLGSSKGKNCFHSKWLKVIKSWQGFKGGFDSSAWIRSGKN